MPVQQQLKSPPVYPEVRVFLLSRKLSNCRPRTLETYQRSIERFLRAVGKPPLEVTKLDVQNYLMVLLEDRKRSPAYVRSIHLCLSIFYKWLQADGLMDHSPMAGIPRPRAPRKGKPFLSQEDFDRLLAVCPTEDFRGARNAAWLWMLWCSGCRLDGLAKLKLTDLDWKNGRLHVVEKGDKPRVVPFTAPAQRAVLKYLKVRGFYMRGNDPYQELWISEERRPLKRTGLQHISRMVQERSGVHFKDMNHIFRRTWLYRNVKNNVPLKVLQLVGGWSDLATLDGYVRAMDSEDAINQVDWQ